MKKSLLLISLLGSCILMAKPAAMPSVQIVDDKARQYWAYQAPQKVDLPVEGGNPVDALVNKELQAAGISPNLKASPRHLLRRLTYDLTGMPPTPEEYATFLSEEFTPALWEKNVDRLLASPEYGRKMASQWLDLVRYAETNAFERDSLKPLIWRYRDYVIDSYNIDLPYNQFITEQLAGDEIAKPTFRSNVATGYLCLMQRDDEPADHHQAHADMVSDMIDITGEAFLGSTMGCAKCHDHKGDPIRQKDYFSMRAFFEAMAPNKLKAAEHYWKDDAVVAQQKALVVEKEKIRNDLIAKINLMPLVPQMQKLMQSQPPLIQLSTNEIKEQWEYFWGVPGNPGWNLPSFDGKGMYKAPMPFHYGAKPHPYNVRASGWREGFYTHSFRKDFNLTVIPEHLLVYTTGNMDEIKIYINGVQVFMGPPIEANDYQIYALSKKDREALTTGKNTLGIVATSNDPVLRHINAGLYTNTIKGMDHHIFASLFPELLIPHYGEEKANQLKSLNQALSAARLEINRGGAQYMKLSENPQILDSFVHLRGSVHGRGENVPVAVPAVMVSSDEAAKLPIVDTYEETKTHGRRLALANWIASEENPLTARVMVNRLWQHCFGYGIVASANDFGTLGEDPTNQALLDWLAVEFMEKGWKIKPLLKTLLTSETYMRSTLPNEEAMKIDPLNIMHWKHNPRRLTAEEVRDTFLTLSNELRLEKPVKPMVRPKMPEAVLATSSTPYSVWPETEGVEANSRSIFIHVKRSIQLPLLSAFDAPQRDSTCPSRFATTVPTQALTMLNSAFVNGRADKFAAFLSEKYAGNLDAQLREGFKLATGREPKEEEITELNTLHQDLSTQYQVNPQTALNRLCLLFLNLNETLYLD